MEFCNEHRGIRRLIFVLGLFGFLGLFPERTNAAAPLTFRYQHHLFTLDPDTHPTWQRTEEMWTYAGERIAPPARFRVDGDHIPALPAGLVRSRTLAWDSDAIAKTIEEKIGRDLSRVPRDVRIRRSESGSIVFTGTGMLGREVLSRDTATLTMQAMTEGIPDISLPVREIHPEVTVDDSELRHLGIREIVAVGESDFRKSPGPRKHNISVGLKKFNGHLIPAGSTFSFNDVLGRVNATTGYWKELVILGAHTLPEYGGGLCQVSTTAYRGAWESGFPIEQRRNHSFAVSYYAPQGTDATIYPPNTDMRFRNDSSGALLIQTYQEGTRAYFVYYGTRTERTADILGPFTWDPLPPPSAREEFTTELPPGETRKASDEHPGLKALWYRIVRDPGKPVVPERVYSDYEARGLLTQIGIGAENASDDISSSSSSASSKRLRNGRRTER